MFITAVCVLFLPNFFTHGAPLRVWESSAIKPKQPQHAKCWLEIHCTAQYIGWNLANVCLALLVKWAAQDFLCPVRDWARIWLRNGFKIVLQPETRENSYVAKI